MLVLSAGALFCFAGPEAQSQELSRSERRALVQACRADVARVCPGAKLGRGAVAQCLRQNLTQLSDGCRSAIAGVAPGSGQTAGAQVAAAQTRVYRNIAYGSHPKQRMDIYVPDGATNAPVIFMVHGGAWAIGSKSASRVVENKIAYWLPKGFIFVSVDNRLLPEANPLVQAQDVAKALAAAQERVRSLGGDPRRFVLMGHSAGAHLVTLLSADPNMATRVGAQLWRGTVALDSAAYDVMEIMKSSHPRLYDRAFGNDPAFWRRASPSAQLLPAARPMLLVCSSTRRTSCAQAEGFEAGARTVGVHAAVLPVAKSHSAINEDLGKPGSYTAAVDRFVQRVVQ
ncbi:alpha/beta hydrolase fold domain-containing protein [Rhizobium herbae]|uniref:Acetyl esterase/lipase n=1 Tax=Rhizobium herbae TaxID=508661 RepID=A0ABS4EUM7_9HYPH|nr:alpha/beta hydrolase fold domain-containing protein [Rhizobium herbae]MBP1861642.1 acetyl esterase/lipase [Rhizobium herbae]